MSALDAAVVRRALDLARRAPSAHNMQPWEVEVRHERIDVRVDRSRTLPHGDPTARDLNLSIGAFTEALVIALAAEGVRAERQDPSRGAFATLVGAGAVKPDPLPASLVRRRQTSRLPYSPREPDRAALDKLTSVARAHGIGLHLAPKGTSERQKLSNWLYASSREGWLDLRAVRELRPWLRFDPMGARQPEEGLSTHCLNLGVPEAAALRAVTRPGLWRTLEKLFAAPMLAEALAKSEVQTADEAPLFAVLVSDGPASGAGGGLLRTWMEATNFGLAVHPLSVLLDRRGWELAKQLGVPTGRLVAAWRLGKSLPPPSSGRRSVSRFARFYEALGEAARQSA